MAQSKRRHFFDTRRALQNPNDSQEERLPFDFSPTIENYNLTTILIKLNFIKPKELTISDQASFTI